MFWSYEAFAVPNRVLWWCNQLTQNIARTAVIDNLLSNSFDRWNKPWPLSMRITNVSVMKWDLSMMATPLSSSAIIQASSNESYQIYYSILLSHLGIICNAVLLSSTLQTYCVPNKDTTHISIIVLCNHFSNKQPVINSLVFSDAIWRQRSYSRLAQVMACQLRAPRHSLNQCWVEFFDIFCNTASIP